MLEMKVVERSELEWTAPFVLLPIKHGLSIFGVEYQKLNAVSECNASPTSRMYECPNSLGDASMFFSLDGNRPHLPGEIEDAYCNKTAFTSHHVLHRLSHMPFKFHNTPGTLQKDCWRYLFTSQMPIHFGKFWQQLHFFDLRNHILNLFAPYRRCCAE